MEEFYEAISKVICRMEDVADIIVGDENVSEYLSEIYGAEVEDNPLYIVSKYITEHFNELA